MILKLIELETHYNNLKARFWHFGNDIKVPVAIWFQDNSMTSKPFKSINTLEVGFENLNWYPDNNKSHMFT